jgi:NDP-sugar pyrophosphorylase family protein
MGIENATVILLAGGFGKRVRHLHPDLPKPLIRVAGRPFIDWICGYWAGQGIRRIIVSLGHLAGVAERHFQSADWGDVEILTVREEEPLGTAGAIVHAARTHACGDPFIVANADSLVFGPVAEAWALIETDPHNTRSERENAPSEPGTQVTGQASDQKSNDERNQASIRVSEQDSNQASHPKSNQRPKQSKSHEDKLPAASPCEGVILGREVADASRYGSLRTNDRGRLLGFQEKQPGGSEEKQPGKALVNAGVYLLRKSLLERFPNRTPLSLELDVFPALLEADADLRVHPVAGDFLDIGTPQDLQRASRFIERHRAELEFSARLVFRNPQ